MVSKERAEMSTEELCSLLDNMEKRVHFYEAAMDSLPNPIFLKDKDLRFVYFNKSYKEFFELQDGQYIGMGVTDLPYLTLEERERYHEEDSEALRKQQVVHYECSYPKGDNPRESLYWSKGFRGADVSGIVGEIVDISKQKQLEEELRVYVRELTASGKKAELEAMIDPNTKLYNRRILENYVPEIVEQCLQTGADAFLYIVDIDYFKQINDTFGHDTGDLVLKKFATILRENVRQNDIVVRYGGDEFLLILPGMVASAALSKAERIIQKVREQVLLPDKKGVSMSVGIASFEGKADIQEAIRRADTALYKGKRGGRGIPVLYQPSDQKDEE